MSELVYIAATPSCAPGYSSELQKYYRTMAEDALQELRPERPKYENGRVVLPWADAGKIIDAQLKVKMKLDHG